MKIYCVSCEVEVTARLTSGKEVYPHRPDLFNLPFWKCDACNNFVGCHHKTANRTKPLGCIPSPAIKAIRKQLHAVIDPIWESGRMSRGAVYSTMSNALGRQYHTADLRSVEEAERMLVVAVEIGRAME